jgi:hypothetical protein
MQKMMKRMFALVLSLGIVGACVDEESTTESALDSIDQHEECPGHDEPLCFIEFDDGRVYRGAQVYGDQCRWTKSGVTYYTTCGETVQSGGRHTAVCPPP